MLFAVSWLFAGLSVIGQPHVMVRFMALDDNNMRKARIWYYLWFLDSTVWQPALLLSRLYLVDTGSFDAELAYPQWRLNYCRRYWLADSGRNLRRDYVLLQIHWC